MQVTVTGDLEQLAGPELADPDLVLHWLVGEDTLYNANEITTVDFEVCPAHHPEEEPEGCEVPGSQWRFRFAGAEWA